MTVSRRHVLAGLAVGPAMLSMAAASRAASTALTDDRFDPWIEVDADALRQNAKAISRLVGGRPILAVIKNNAYGLGLTTVAPILEPLPEIKGFAVVKTSEALELREAGIRKPVLLMGLFSRSDGAELVRQGVELSVCTDDSVDRIREAAKVAGVPAAAQIYLDTGMGRMGIPYHRALPVLETIHEHDLNVRGTFMGFTESDFDIEQLGRFREFAGLANDRGILLGSLHAASSHAVFSFGESHLDQVRPGIALFGAYPSGADSAREAGTLTPAVSLKARISRVERLRSGDSVSYGRNYVARGPTWTATIPAGHTDGYPRVAVNGARVFVNGETFPVIGAVSASHTIIELGAEKKAGIGDVATLLGPDHPDVHPNTLAATLDTSVYDRLMHLNPLLPKVVV